MTQSHIKFAPLILPRKTPAEELREAMAILESRRHCETYDRLEALAARLETPDAPKRWDGVFPWVGELGRDNANVHLSPELRWHLLSNCTCVYTGEATHGNDMPANQSPYHDGVIITITAGSGDEFPRIHQSGLNFYWVLAARLFVVLKVEEGGSMAVGEVYYNRADCNGKPLPPGTVTRIVINNTLPTTEQRYSVEVVEAEPVPVKPEFERVVFGGADGKRFELWQDCGGFTFLDKALGSPSYLHSEDVLDAAKCFTAAANHLDPQEQPATEAVSGGLQLEFRCSLNNSDSFEVWHDTPAGRLVLDHRDYNIHLSPADEARLRNLLNQRHADWKGGAE